MSRGPTRRLQALIATGAVTDDDYTAAAVEADLSSTPTSASNTSISLALKHTE